MNNLPKSIYDLDFHDLEMLLQNWGEPSYRVQQIWQGLYKQFYEYPDQLTNLPGTLRQNLKEQFGRVLENKQVTFSSLDPTVTQDSSDMATRKVLFNLADHHLIETVLMKYDQRRTLCISTQSGCAMGCVFCATGQMGFFRHLTSGEIIEQVLYFSRQLLQQQEHVTNIVLMGMGEPFHNYDATMDAIDRMNHPAGMNLGSRRFTISTVGLIPVIQRFSREKRQVNLAVSLHAADDDLRSSMLPINKRYPIEDLMQACREYVNLTHRRITFEWALIEEVNDTPEQARKLAGLLKGLTVDGTILCHVNAIPLNPTQNYSGKATGKIRAKAFKDELEKFGIACTIRLRRGIDIQAGCGQLAGKERNRT